MNPSIQKVIAQLRQNAALANDPQKLATTYIAIDAAVDAAIAEEKSRVLASALAWGRDGQELARRAHETTLALGGIGLLLSETCGSLRARDGSDERLQQIILLALANYGSATRWAAMLRHGPKEPPYPAVHALYRRAESIQAALAPGRVVRDGIARPLTAEAHYLRNLLLPLLCHESLDPQQLEIIDTLLWDWSVDYRLTRQMLTTSPRLWVDLDGRAGVSLRQFMPEGEDVRHLVVANMSRHLLEATQSFHDGRFPVQGCAADFPLEAHSAVLDHLASVLEHIEAGPPRRRFERFTRLEPLRVEALIGLKQIQESAFTKTGQGLAMHVYDESEGGAALLVDRSTWETVWHGDLVAIRVEDRSIAHLGVVVRKFATGPEGFAIGLEWICREPRNLTLREAKDEPSARTVPTLYLPEGDVSGRLDMVLLDENQFLQGTRYEVTIDDRVFEIGVNRLLRRGRGWVAAGYEIVGVHKAEMVA
jgi:hypothetical protein